MSGRDAFPAFFVVGTGRCGTNLLRRLLLAHPDVHVVRETHWLPCLFDRWGLGRAPFAELLESAKRIYMAKGLTSFERIAKFENLTAAEMEEALLEQLAPATEGTIADLMGGFYRLQAARNGARICGDKTPDYGFCMRMLHEIWPDARFVHIYRDGRDVALSMLRVKSFRYLVACKAEAWFEIGYEKAYERGRSLVGSELEIERFFDLWKARLLRTRLEREGLPAGSYLELRYEEVLREPRRALEAIEGFLELSGAGDGHGFLERWKRRRWIERALPLVRGENLGKNAGDAEHRRLTQRYGETLEAMGFRP